MPIQGRRVEQKKPTISEKISAFFNGVGRKFKEVGGFIKQNPKKVVALSLCFIILAGFVVVEVVKNKNKDGQLDINQDVMTKQEQLIGEKDSIIGKKDEIIDELEQGVQDAEKERDEVAAENEVLAGRLSKEQSKTLVNVLFSENPEILKTMQMDTVEFDVREKEDGKATTVLKYTKENGTHVLYEIDMQIIDNADGLNQGVVIELGAGT